MNSKTVITRYRSAITGRFVSDKFAKMFPKNTIKQNMKKEKSRPS